MEQYQNSVNKIKLENKEIKLSHSVKYLGVIIDKNLNFKDNINYVCKKVSKKLGVLNRCSNYLSSSTKCKIYNAIVLPHFIYANTILYMANKNEMQRLQKLQNRGMRTILKCNKYTRIDDMLNTLNWLDVRNLIKYFSMVFIHKINLKLLPDYLHLAKNCDVHQYETRSRNNFATEFRNKKSSQNSIFSRGVVEYNGLPEQFKSANLKTFQRLLKNYLRNQD